MTAKEFRKEQEYEWGHFQELTGTGINPNYINIEKFAEDYHQAKLKLLGIADVVVPKGTLCETCQDKGQYYAGTLIGYVDCPDCNE